MQSQSKSVARRMRPTKLKGSEEEVEQGEGDAPSDCAAAQTMLGLHHAAPTLSGAAPAAAASSVVGAYYGGGVCSVGASPIYGEL